MDFLCEDLINEIPKNGYTKLTFGKIPLARKSGFNLRGQFGSENPEKFYQNSGVIDGEQVVAYLVKKSFPGIESVLMTNHAMYSGAMRIRKKEPRFSWSDLPRFFIMRENSTAEVLLYQSKEVQYTVWRSSLFDSASGNDLTDFLIKMQRSILAEHPEMQAERATQLEVLKSECKDMMKTGAISNGHLSALKYLLLEPEYKEQSALLMATDYARSHTEAQHCQWVNSLPEIKTDDLRKKMVDLCAAEQEKTICDLESEAIQFDLKYLESVENNFSNANNLSAKESYLLGLVCTRLKKWEKVDSVIRVIRGKMGFEKLKHLYFPRYFFAVAQMRHVLQSIKTDAKCLPKDEWSFFDPMGLTSFHYALIIENQKTRSELLYSKKMWPSIPQNQATAFGNVGIYDYLCLAVFKNLPMEQLKKVAIRTNEEAFRLNKSLTNSENIGLARNIFLGATSLLLDVGASSNNTETRAEFTEKKKEWKEYSDEQKYEQRANSLGIRDELEACVRKLIADAEKKVAQWESSTEPAVRYLLHIYSDPDYLEQTLTKNGKWMLSQRGDFYYMSPQGEIEAHKVSQDV